MENIEIKTIYNIPEPVSGIGFISHLTGLCLYILLFISAIPCLLIDRTGLQDFLNLVQDSGFFASFGIFFIFVLCPIYFFVRFFMEFFRTKKSRYKFYSTPNIEYITFNDDHLFFKNTIKNNDVLIMKSDITDIELKGTIRTCSQFKTHLNTTFVEHLTLTIKTENKIFVINPDIKIKQKGRQQKSIQSLLKMDMKELIKLQIDLYKKHFANFRTVLESDGRAESTLLTKELNNYAS